METFNVNINAKSLEDLQKKVQSLGSSTNTVIMLPTYYTNLPNKRKEIALVCKSLMEYTKNNNEYDMSLILNKYVNIGKFYFILFDKIICGVSSPIHNSTEVGYIIGVNRNKEFIVKTNKYIFITSFAKICVTNSNGAVQSIENVLSDNTYTDEVVDEYTKTGGKLDTSSAESKSIKSINYIKTYKKLDTDNYFSTSTRIEEGLCE